MNAGRVLDFLLLATEGEDTPESRDMNRIVSMLFFLLPVMTPLLTIMIYIMFYFSFGTTTDTVLYLLFLFIPYVFLVVANWMMESKKFGSCLETWFGWGWVGTSFSFTHSLILLNNFCRFFRMPILIPSLLTCSPHTGMYFLTLLALLLHAVLQYDAGTDMLVDALLTFNTWYAIYLLFCCCCFSIFLRCCYLRVVVHVCVHIYRVSVFGGA